MLKNKKKPVLIIAAAVISVAAVLTAVISLCSENYTVKPMVCYNESVYVRSDVAIDIDVDGLNYLGKIIYIVPSYQIPGRNFECNSQEFLNKSLYSGIGNELYLELENSNFVLLEKL